MAKSRIQIAKNDIIAFFENLGQKTFSEESLGQVLSENRYSWRLAERTSTGEFVRFLLEKTKLQEIKLTSSHGSIDRYTWGDASSYQLALSLKPRAYLTHYTAVYLHGLTEQIPKTIYVNYEQAPKRQHGLPLEQWRIDSAFQKPVRTSSYIFTYEDQKVCVINGKHTGNLGVVEIEGPQGETLYVTDVERTLIDIAVRPVYAGGVYEVQKAYREAKGNVSVNKLAAMLKKINYIYPYHQVIGFYMDKAGYKESSLRLLKKIGLQYNFYLTHQMEQKEYSHEWRLYFPKDF